MFGEKEVGGRALSHLAFADIEVSIGWCGKELGGSGERSSSEKGGVKAGFCGYRD